MLAVLGRTYQLAKDLSRMGTFCLAQGSASLLRLSAAWQENQTHSFKSDYSYASCSSLGPAAKSSADICCIHWCDMHISILYFCSLRKYYWLRPPEILRADLMARDGDAPFHPCLG